MPHGITRVLCGHGWVVSLLATAVGCEKCLIGFWGPQFEASIQFINPFTHNWYLPCCQCTETCSRVSSLQKNHIYPSQSIFWEICVCVCYIEGYVNIVNYTRCYSHNKCMEWLLSIREAVLITMYYTSNTCTLMCTAGGEWVDWSNKNGSPIYVYIYILWSCAAVCPKIYAHGAWFCCLLLWFDLRRLYPYPSGLLHWHWGNHMIAPVPVKQSWKIWIDISHWPSKYW